MSGWRSSRAWAPGLVALGCAASFALSTVAPVEATGEDRARRTPTVSQEGRALLGDLQVGDKIVGWTVEAIDGPRDGELRVDLGRDGVRFSLMVVALEGASQTPVLQTERHGIFWGHVHPPETILPDGTIRASTHALARRIRANEARVTVPGM